MRAPGLLLQLAEARALFEFGAFLAASPLLRFAGKGDGHPVIVLPGFLGDEQSTLPLRWVLRAQGYWVHDWGLGQNIGPTEGTVDAIHDLLRQVYKRHGRKVSLVGWSLGGMYAREMARTNPMAVRQVITLGTPFRFRRGDRSSVSHIADRLSPLWKHEAMRMTVDEQDKPRLLMPATSVYSRSDGVARWQACLDTVTDRCENVEVSASHTGLGFHPAAVMVVSDRLAQPEGDWRPFVPPLCARGLFPEAASWRQAS
jgi:pimeloyl-ACP methyl ester carboxylesterase